MWRRAAVGTCPSTLQCRAMVWCELHACAHACTHTRAHACVLSEDVYGRRSWHKSPQAGGEALWGCPRNSWSEPTMTRGKTGDARLPTAISEYVCILFRLSGRGTEGGGKAGLILCAWKRGGSYNRASKIKVQHAVLRPRRRDAGFFGRGPFFVPPSGSHTAQFSPTIPRIGHKTRLTARISPETAGDAVTHRPLG